MTKHYDLVVIGSGPAGRRAAIQGAKAGCQVLVIEKGRKVGGVSVHTGTIPSKTLRETVLNLTGWRERGFYGRSYRVKTDISSADLQKRLTMTLEHEVEVLEDQFARNRVATLHGVARFVSAHAVEVLADDGLRHRVSADYIVIAVGTAPHRPSRIPFDGVNVLDSDEILNLAHIPKRLTVIGGGVIGLEYATIFSALDVRVTLVDRAADILPFVDREIVGELLHELRQRGVALRLASDIAVVDRQSDGCRVVLADGRQILSDVVLYAAGRVGATAALGLDALSMCPDERGRIAVDPLTFQTTSPNVFAAGDVIGFPSLASTSMEQGRLAACHALGLVAYSPPMHFPYGIYSVPEVSICGISEEEARQRNLAYEVGTARYEETSRGHIMGLRYGLMKLLFALNDHRLLGVHIVGEGATELIHIGQAVLNLGGGLSYFIENTFNYPTLAECYKIAALDAWNRMGGPPADYLRPVDVSIAFGTRFLPSRRSA